MSKPIQPRPDPKLALHTETVKKLAIVVHSGLRAGPFWPTSHNASCGTVTRPPV